MAVTYILSQSLLKKFSLHEFDFKTSASCLLSQMYICSTTHLSRLQGGMQKHATYNQVLPSDSKLQSVARKQSYKTLESQKLLK